MSRTLVDKRRSNQDEDEQPATRRHGGVHQTKQMRIDLSVCRDSLVVCGTSTLDALHLNRSVNVGYIGPLDTP